MKKMYLSHSTAAYFWNIPNLDVILGNDFAINKDLTECTVTTPQQRYKKEGYIIHLCTAKLPLGAVLIKEGQYVSSPELVFLQYAEKLDIHRLILLGLQLCSHPVGQPELAITTTQKLNNFIAKANWHRGHRKALRAVKYLADGSASIPESLTYMILTLPHSLGGYGLSGAVFNHEIKLKDEDIKQIKQNKFFVDLFYKSKKVVVEYDSHAYHNTPQSQGKDSVKSQILTKYGYRVMNMCTIQLYESKACRDFAYNLASELNKRIRIKSKKFEDMHVRLRSLLDSCRTTFPHQK